MKAAPRHASARPPEAILAARAYEQLTADPPNTNLAVIVDTLRGITPDSLRGIMFNDPDSDRVQAAGLLLWEERRNGKR